MSNAGIKRNHYKNDHFLNQNMTKNSYHVFFWKDLELIFESLEISYESQTYLMFRNTVIFKTLQIFLISQFSYTSECNIYTLKTNL